MKVPALERHTEAGFLLALLVVAALLPELVSPQYVLLGITTLVAMLVAVSFNLLFGYAGLFSFGQAAFYGLSAYVTAVLVNRTGVNFYAALAAGVAASTLMAGFSGTVLVRLEPVAFIMLTFALAELCGFASSHLSGITNGTSGLNVELPASLNIIVDTNRVYYIVLGLVALAILASYALIKTSAGLILQGVRDDAARSRTIGVNVVRWRVFAFAFSAAIAGLGGGLAVVSSQIVYPSVFGWEVSTIALIMVLLGGVGRQSGPVVGAIVLSLVDFYVGRLTTDVQLVDGAILLVIVLAAPSGLVGVLGSGSRWLWAHRRRSKEATAGRGDVVAAGMEVKQ